MPFSPWLGGHSQASRQEEACLFPLQTGWEPTALGPLSEGGGVSGGVCWDPPLPLPEFPICLHA